MAWFNTSYLYKKQLTIDHTKVSGGSNLSSFPVLMSATDADLKTVANGGKVQNSSGFDIIFTDSAESTKLDHEIESYTASSGLIVMWVRIPTLSASADTVIYMYFGNSSISTSQEAITSVWDSNFTAVWHLDAATGSSQPDSTSNGKTGTVITPNPSQSSGKMNGSLSFSSSGGIQVASAPVLGSAFTVDLWVNPNSVAATNQCVIGNYNATGWLFRQGTSSAQALEFYNNSATFTTGNVLSASVWQKVSVVYNGSTYIIYYNGSAVLTSSAGQSAPSGGSTAMDIGRVVTGFVYTGGIDEVRMSNVARSAGWIATEYNSQNNPATFYSVGAIQTQVTTNTMGGTESNTASDVGGTQQSGVDALSASDVAGTRRWGIDALVGSDSTLYTDTTQLIESNTAADMGNIQSWALDALIASDALLATDNASFVEQSTGNDSSLQTSSYSGIESLTGSDQASYTDSTAFVENNTIVDSASYTDNTACIDALTASDSYLNTNALQGIENLIGSDALAVQGNVQTIESNTVTDSAIYTDSTNFIESASASDIGNLQSWQLESLTGSDSLASARNTAFIEALTIVDSLLAADNTAFVESNSGDDNGGMTQQASGGITTNNMGGEDDLVISDLGGMRSWSVDVIIAADSGVQTGNYTATEALLGSDSSSNSGIFSGIETLVITDTAIYIISPLSTDILVGSDQSIYTDQTAFVESNTGNDSGGMSEVSTVVSTNAMGGIDALVGSDLGGMCSWLVDGYIISDSGGMVEAVPVIPIAGLVPNVTAYIRSGNSTFLVRSGKATFPVRAGNATVFVRGE